MQGRKNRLRGAGGEAAAAEFLRKKKYRIEAMGYRSRYGEIDIIASDKDFIVFAEVKLRKSSSFAQAREFVDERKQQRIKTTAQMWLAENETDLQPRFDVIEIYASENMSKMQINHIEDAFE
jgi:putative endonuclease